MRKQILQISLALCLLLTATSCGFAKAAAVTVIEAIEPEESDMDALPFDMGFDFAEGLLDDTFRRVGGIEDDFTEGLFDDEDTVIKETIPSDGVNSITLESVYGAVQIEASPDGDIHLEYPEKARFTITHEIADGELTVTAKTPAPGNYDVLRVLIPLNAVDGLAILEGASNVRLIGQEGMLGSLNIESALASVSLENIYADTTVKTGTGTVRMKNDTIRSNIRLTAETGVIDVELGELPEDVSLYTKGGSVRNSLFEGRGRVSPEEKYALTLENAVGGIHIH